MKSGTLSVAIVLLAGGIVWAQEEEAALAAEGAPAQQAGKAATKAFTTLPLCRLVEGTAEVLKPGESQWAPAEEGRFYPLGTSYRTVGGDSRLDIAFGPESKASIGGDASFVTLAQGLGGQVRTVAVQTGVLELDLAHNLPEGAFVVSAPGFTVRNPAGKSRIDYRTLGDGDEAIIRCVTGTLAVEGRHFSIAQMRAANEIRIRSSKDYLFTALYGTSGDYVVSLDGGVVAKTEVQDDGSVKNVTAKETIDWHLTPETRVEIMRSLPAIGERMSVYVTTWDAAGEKQNERAYAEGRAEVNSGELVKKMKSDAEEIAKKAAEATEETTAAVEEDEKPAENASNNENNNN